MSGLTDLNHDVFTMSRTHLGARAVTFTAGATFVATLGAAGDLSLLPAAAMVGAVLLATWHPHTLFPVLAIAYLVTNWITLMPGTWTVWTLPAALCLLVLHAGAAVCAAVPAQAPLPAPVWATTGRRVGVVAGFTMAVWILSAVIEGTDVGSGVVPAVAALAVLGLALGVHYRLFVRPQADSLR
ncbi:MAG: hypothetical protein WBG89_04275 [Ornithinimicrobium sp.]